MMADGRMFLVYIVIALSCIGVSGSGNVVRELTPESFTNVVFAKPTLVKFYAPWCGHCQHLAPIFEATAAAMLLEHPNYQLVAVNCVEHSGLCNTFNVHSYPTMKLIRPAMSDDELIQMAATSKASDLVRLVYHYNGPRTVEGFQQYLVGDNTWSANEGQAYPLPTAPVPLSMKPQRHGPPKKNALHEEQTPDADAAVTDNSLPEPIKEKLRRRKKRLSHDESIHNSVRQGAVYKTSETETETETGTETENVEPANAVAKAALVFDATNSANERRVFLRLCPFYSRSSYY